MSMRNRKNQKRAQKRNLQRRSRRREANRQASHAFRFGDSKAADKARRASAERTRKRKVFEAKVRGEIAKATSVKALKKLAKSYGVTGYSDWTAKDRGNAEACIVEAALSGAS
jgi:hypothetical protein